MKVSVFERKQPSGKVTFYLNISQNGTRRKEKLDFEKVYPSSKDYTKYKRLAETIAAKRTVEIVEGKYDVPLMASSSRLLEYFNLYVANYQNKDVRKAHAMHNYLKEYVTKDIELSAVDEVFAEGFRNHLRRSLTAEGTRNYFSIFKKAMNQAVKLKLIKVNLTRDVTVDMKGTNNNRIKKSVLSIDKLRVLSKTACQNESLKDAFLFSCNTGITLSELRTLEHKHIRSGKLFYKRHKTNNQVEVEVYLNENAKRIIDKRFKDGYTDFVFPDLPTTNGVNKTLRNWVKRAEIDKHITFYCSRHTFGTLQAENGVNQSVIAKNMGHQSTRHTDKYINHVDKAQERAVQFDTF